MGYYYEVWFANCEGKWFPYEKGKGVFEGTKPTTFLEMTKAFEVAQETYGNHPTVWGCWVKPCIQGIAREAAKERKDRTCYRCICSSVCSSFNSVRNAIDSSYIMMEPEDYEAIARILAGKCKEYRPKPVVHASALKKTRGC